MCGFASLFESYRNFDSMLLDEMDRDLFHRGPDSGGRLSGEGYALVFRRLAIIDLSPASDQPMVDPDGRFAIVFNGEIYNYQNLRKELQANGEVFRTKGDTEVILRGYRVWGKSVFSRLEGMFAVVIWDRKLNKGIAARDPLGIKPLYIARDQNLVAFSSEMRPLRRMVGSKPDVDAVSELLMYRFAAGRLSNIQGIELLKGGTLVEFEPSTGKVHEEVYCDFLDSFQPIEGMSEAGALDISRDAILESIELHLQSDTGFAVQLSGGVDSSLVTAVIKENHPERQLITYGINLSPLPQDESLYRNKVIQRYGIEHHEVHMDGADFAESLPEAIARMEGPSAHYGCVMLMRLCEQIKKTDKVVLTGEGADEVFGGYARYSQWRELERLGKKARRVPELLWPFLKRYRGAQRYAQYDPAIVSSVYFDFLQIKPLFPDLFNATGWREEVAGRFHDFRDRMMAVDQASYLSSLLMRQDKMAMAASVEARVPFTHMPLLQKINRIPREIRIPGGETKPLLKKISEPWLPNDLLYRRKVGLTLPLDDWLRAPKLLGRYLEYLTSSDSRLANYGDRAGLLKLVEDFRKGKRSNEMPPLMNLVNMEIWLRSLDDGFSIT